jgi:hypothetical protein
MIKDHLSIQTIIVEGPRIEYTRATPWRSIRPKNQDPRSSCYDDLDLPKARGVTTRRDTCGSTAWQQIPLPICSSPYGRGDHHSLAPSGYVVQLLGSAGDLTPRRGSPHKPRSEVISNASASVILPWRRAVCVAARSPSTQSASSASSASCLAPTPPNAICLALPGVGWAAAGD